MASFNTRLRQLEKSASAAKDPDIERLEMAARHLTHDELVELSDMSNDREEHTPAQRAALARIETLAEQFTTT